MELVIIDYCSICEIDAEVIATPKSWDSNKCDLCRLTRQTYMTEKEKRKVVELASYIASNYPKYQNFLDVLLNRYDKLRRDTDTPTKKLTQQAVRIDYHLNNIIYKMTVQEKRRGGDVLQELRAVVKKTK